MTAVSWFTSALGSISGNQIAPLPIYDFNNIWTVCSNLAVIREITLLVKILRDIDEWKVANIPRNKFTFRMPTEKY